MSDEPTPAGARTIRIGFRRRAARHCRPRSSAVALAPPLLILVCAGGVAGYRLWRTDWPGLGGVGVTTTWAPVTVPAPSRIVTTPLPAPAPVIARIRTDPPPAPAPVAQGESPADPFGFDLPPQAKPEPRPTPIPEPEAAAALAAATPLIPFARPEPPRPVSKDDALAAIAREADEARAQLRQEDQLKAQATAREQAETRERQAEQARRAVRFIEDERYLFHGDLADILAQPNRHRADEIADLCRRRKVAMPPELRRSFDQARIGLASHLGRRTRVELYRRRGIPEEMILFDLANEELSHVGLRNGPKTRDEALVVAARRLLDYGLPSRSPASVANAAAHPGQVPPGRAR